MKIVLNECFGGFSLSDHAANVLGVKVYDRSIEVRTDPMLIAMVEMDPEVASGEYAELYVGEIPENATDWEISEYDGIESITAVVDGKLVHC